ncbi:MAG: CoA-binding protein [Dehalococcoidia bacterium]
MRTIEQILRESKTVAVVGLSPNHHRDSHSVAEYLQRQGYRVVPVNPNVEEVLGLKCYPDLRSIPEPVDLVDVFRRSEEVPSIAREAVAIKAKALWLQLGVVSQEAAEIARRGGLDVVMDRCTHAEHARLVREGPDESG